MKIFLPGTRANVARHFVCQASANSVLRNGGAAHAADSSSPSLALSQAVGTFNRRPNRTVRMSPECAAAYVAPRRNPRTFPVSGQSGKTAFSLSNFRISSMETSLALSVQIGTFLPELADSGDYRKY